MEDEKLADRWKEEIYHHLCDDIEMKQFVDSVIAFELLPLRTAAG